MNKEEIVRMAREAGVKSPDLYKLTVSHMSIETLERLIQAARAAGAAAEREQCERIALDPDHLVPHWPQATVQQSIAAAIRARGNA